MQIVLESLALLQSHIFRLDSLPFHLLVVCLCATAHTIRLAYILRINAKSSSLVCFESDKIDNETDSNWNAAWNAYSTRRLSVKTTDKRRKKEYKMNVQSFRRVKVNRAKKMAKKLRKKKKQSEKGNAHYRISNGIKSISAENFAFDFSRLLFSAPSSSAVCSSY